MGFKTNKTGPTCHGTHVVINLIVWISDMLLLFNFEKQQYYNLS